MVESKKHLPDQEQRYLLTATGTVGYPFLPPDAPRETTGDSRFVTRHYKLDTAYLKIYSNMKLLLFIEVNFKDA